MEFKNKSTTPSRQGSLKKFRVDKLKEHLRELGGTFLSNRTYRIWRDRFGLTRHEVDAVFEDMVSTGEARWVSHPVGVAIAVNQRRVKASQRVTA